MHTTLNAIRAQRPCAGGWERLLRHLGKTKADGAPLSLLTVLESNGLDDALWCLRAVEGRDADIQRLALTFARQVQYLMTDERSVAALDVAERYLAGRATAEEVRDARAAACAAYLAAACAAADAACAAACAAYLAARAADAAARDRQAQEFRRIFKE